MEVKKGQRYRCVKEVRMDGFISLRGPFTGGFEGIMPVGEEIIISSPGKSAAYADIPQERYKTFEETHVPEEDRADEYYTGFYLCVRYKELEEYYELIEDVSDDSDK